MKFTRGQMKWRTHEGQGSQQNLQQWSRLMQNGQKFESVLWRMEFTVYVNDRVAAYSAHNLY